MEEIQEKMSMKDFLLKEYELNESYHDTKANSLWLGFVLFYTFNFAEIVFLDNSNSTLDLSMLTVLAILDGVITIAAFMFLKKQIRLKFESVIKTSIFRDLISRMQNAEIVEWFSCDQKKRIQDEIKGKHIKCSKVMQMEICLVIIFVAVFLMKLIILLSKYNKNVGLSVCEVVFLAVSIMVYIIMVVLCIVLERTN